MENSLTHRFVDVNGVRLHIAEQGQGPLALLQHGWPESCTPGVTVRWALENHPRIRKLAAARRVGDAR